MILNYYMHYENNKSFQRTNKGTKKKLLTTKQVISCKRFVFTTRNLQIAICDNKKLKVTKQQKQLLLKNQKKKRQKF